MRDQWEYIKDRWECDSLWREQITLAIILGLIGLGFVCAEVFVRRAGGPVARP